LEPAALDSLEDVAVVVAWIDEADPLVGACVREAVAHFPRASAVDWPRAQIDALFMREVADVHRELYAENAELYGDEVATKIERCLAVSDAEATLAARNREEYREECAAVFDGFDLLLTPTLSCVAPPVGIGDLHLRGTL